MLLEIREERLPVEARKRGLRRDDRLVELSPRSPDEMRAEHHRPRADRLRMVASQRFAERGVSEAPVCVPGKDTETCQRTKQSTERWGMRARRASQIIRALRVRAEQVGDAEFRRNVDRLN